MAAIIEQELSLILAKEIQEEIDSAVIINLLIGLGWHLVSIDTNPPELQEWVDINIKHEYKTFQSRWIFENQQDANWFALKWL